MAQLILSRAGAGKTARVQEALLDLKLNRPLAKAWVLLSTERQIVDFRQRFTTRGRVFFNIEYFNFYSLYRRILATARVSGRVLPPHTRESLIRALLREDFADAPVFGRIADQPGFARAIAALIDELKQHRIQPAAFLDAASDPRQHELAAIYDAYQSLLQRYDLIDREGEGWLAVEALQASPSLVSEVKLLIVDGYDQFNPLQAALLAELDKQIEAAQITLTTVSGRETTIGRRFEGARLRLHEAFGDRLDEILADDREADDRPPPLHHLLDRLLLPNPDAHRLSTPIADEVTWLEAPDPPREAAAVMRRVKRLLRTGCDPECVLIAIHNWGMYGRHLATYARLYGVPLALHFGEAPAENPAVAALIDLLRLHAEGFRRREVLDSLRSPYFDVPGLPAEAVDELERISREARVIGGREEWLDAVRLAGDAPPSARDDDEDDDEAVGSRLTPETADAFVGALAAFFDGVTPPETGEVEDYVRWLEGLIGSDADDPDDAAEPAAPTAYTLNMPLRIRQQGGEQIGRDLSAMKRLKDVLVGLIAGSVLAGSIDLPRAGDRAGFLNDLFSALTDEPIERGSGRGGRALATTSTNARGLPHAHVFVLGLAEGVFPAPIPSDLLLLDGERAHLRERGIGLPNSSERAADDGLFYGLIGAARESLTLSRPYIQNGEAWAASHLWHASRAVFDLAEVSRVTVRLPLDGVPAFGEDAASLSEAALAAADGLRRDEADADSAVRWLKRDYPSYWTHIARAAQVESGRMSAAPYDAYSGVLSDASLIESVAEDIEARVWSASALNEYGTCPFKFLAHRLLGIEPLEDHQDGMDVRQLGILQHAILETTYRAMAEEGLAIQPDDLPRALELLNAAADALLPDAPQRLGFRESAVWAGEQVTIRRKLRALVTADFSDDNPLRKLNAAVGRTPYWQEARFGTTTPLIFNLGGASIRVRGTIDRIDLLSDGGAVIVDYKSGSRRIDAGEIERGRNFQMLVYLEAAAQMLSGGAEPHPVVGGTFWHIPNNGGSGALDPFDEDAAKILDEGWRHLRAYLERMKKGDFRSRPNKQEDGKCAAYCDFYQLCRSAVIPRDKQRPLS